MAQEPQRIAIDARILGKSTGTYARFLLKHLQQLDTSGLEFDVLLRDSDFDSWHPTAPNFRKVRAEYKDFTVAEQWDFLKQLNAARYDLVHFCMQQQPFLYRGKKVSTFHDLTLLKWRNTAKNPLVFTFKQQVAKFVFYRSVRTATHLIAPSEYSKDDVVRFGKIPADRVTVTYLAAEIEGGSKHSQISTSLEGKPYVLYVGNFFSYKNVEILGEAIQQLLPSHPDLELVLVGRLDGSGEQLKQKFAEQGYRNIRFTGYISDDERDALYAGAQAYVFPSFLEGFGLPGLEAMAHGVPVISSNATCLPEVYRDAALYFDPQDASGLAGSISRLLDDPAERQRLIQQGQELLTQYSWAKTAEETLAVYRAALESK